MSKKTNAILLSLLAGVTALAFALPVSAHHAAITQNASCNGYTVKAEYVGGSSVRRVLTDVDFKLDGSPTEEINQDWRGIDDGFTIFTRTGAGNHQVKATGTVKLYECGGNVWSNNQKCDEQKNGNNNHNDDNGWDLVSTETFNLDYQGQCVTPTPQPSPTATPSATPTPQPTPTEVPQPTPTDVPEPTPTEIPSPTPTETPEPTPTEEPTPTPTPEVTVTPAPSVTPKPTDKPCGDECKPREVPKTPITATQCAEDSIARAVANPHVYRKGDKARVVWFKDDSNYRVAIYYGINGQGEQHAVIVSNTGEFEISGLGTGDFTFWVQYLNGCNSGPKSNAIIDGATDGWVLFR